MHTGIPKFRTRVLYVPQRPSLLPGTPRDFINTILSFSSLNPKSKHNKENRASQSKPFDPYTEPIHVAAHWGIDEELWDRTWSSLSGGEAQRISLAVAVGLRSADVLLLDGKLRDESRISEILLFYFTEPTSALDEDSSIKVERYLLDAVRAKDGGLSALVWITHSQEQGGRVGSRFLKISGGCIHEERPDSGV